jgi:hypothetical protein
MLMKTPATFRIIEPGEKPKPPVLPDDSSDYDDDDNVAPPSSFQIRKSSGTGSQKPIPFLNCDEDDESSSSLREPLCIDSILLSKDEQDGEPEKGQEDEQLSESGQEQVASHKSRKRKANRDNGCSQEHSTRATGADDDSDDSSMYTPSDDPDEVESEEETFFSAPGDHTDSPPPHPFATQPVQPSPQPSHGGMRATGVSETDAPADEGMATVGDDALEGVSTVEGDTVPAENLSRKPKRRRGRITENTDAPPSKRQRPGAAASKTVLKSTSLAQTIATTVTSKAQEAAPPPSTTTTTKTTASRSKAKTKLSSKSAAAAIPKSEPTTSKGKVQAAPSMSVPVTQHQAGRLVVTREELAARAQEAAKAVDVRKVVSFDKQIKALSVSGRKRTIVAKKRTG